MRVRKIIISRMAKPEEVLVVLDDTGEPVRADDADTENLSLYRLQKELLINLAKNDWENMK